jgi:flagellar hook protein FlgE
MGYPLTDGGPAVVANGYAGLEVLNIGSLAMQANASTEGRFYVNLPYNADVITADLPSGNDPDAVFTAMTSLVSYDDVGNEVILDVYSTKTGATTWEVAVYDRATAAPGGGFFWAAGNGNSDL